MARTPTTARPSSIADEEGRLELALLVEREPTDPPGWIGAARPGPRGPRGALRPVRRRADARATRGTGATRSTPGPGTYGADVVLAYPTNSVRRFGPAVDRFRAAIAEGRLAHDGDPDLARHLANARLVRGPGRAADDGHALFTLEKAGPRPAHRRRGRRGPRRRGDRDGPGGRAPADRAAHRVAVMALQPCLDCHAPARGARCPSCARRRDTARQAARGGLYRGSWPARARAQRAAAPWCAACGSTRDLCADHIVPGDPGSPLRTLCRPCNAARANRDRRRARPPEKELR